MPSADSEELSLEEDSKENKLLSYFSRDNDIDKCPLNPTYNKNEFRFGTSEASVLNYCLVVGNDYNPLSYYAASRLNLYFLVKFHKDVETPIVGYTVKSKDGLLVSCSNSRWIQEDLLPKNAGELGLYRFEIDLNLCDGDWFIDLAVADSETGPLLDNREGMIHLHVLPNKASKGIAMLDTKISEISMSETNDVGEHSNAA